RPTYPPTIATSSFRVLQVRGCTPTPLQTPLACHLVFCAVPVWERPQSVFLSSIALVLGQPSEVSPGLTPRFPSLFSPQRSTTAFALVGVLAVCSPRSNTSFNCSTSSSLNF